MKRVRPAHPARAALLARRLAHLLAAKPVTLAGFALLGATVLALQFHAVYDGAGSAWVALPLGLLAANLAAALWRWPALRRGALGVFHVGLLALMVLAAWGRLTHFNGRLEIAEGAAFDAAQVEVLSRGPWLGAALDALHWSQGAIQVEYGAGIKRGRTRSEVLLPGAADAAGVGAPRAVGDDTPLVLDGFRFYTTHNKGYAPVLSWHAGAGQALVGAVHMPSYPLREWQQENRWVAPDGRELALSLQVEDALDPERPWALRAAAAKSVLTVRAGAQTWTLAPGEAFALGDATLRYERLGMWMGYTVFRDATLLPMLVVALLAIAGLGWHLWRRLGGQPIGLGHQVAPAALPDAAATPPRGPDPAAPAGPWTVDGGRA